jgi:hypothetical protein
MFHFDTSPQAPGALWTILMALSATVNMVCHNDILEPLTEEQVEPYRHHRAQTAVHE